MPLNLEDNEIAVLLGNKLLAQSPTIKIDKPTGDETTITATIKLKGFISNTPTHKHEMLLGEVGFKHGEDLDVRLPEAIITYDQPDPTNPGVCFLDLKIRINNFKKVDHPSLRLEFKKHNKGQ